MVLSLSDRSFWRTFDPTTKNFKVYVVTQDRVLCKLIELLYWRPVQTRFHQERRYKPV